MARGMAFVAVTAIAIVVMHVWSRFSWASYRYLLTVEVETPEGLREASVVHEVRARWIGRGSSLGQRGQRRSADRALVAISF